MNFKTFNHKALKMIPQSAQRKINFVIFVSNFVFFVVNINLFILHIFKTSFIFNILKTDWGFFQVPITSMMREKHRIFSIFRRQNSPDNAFGRKHSRINTINSFRKITNQTHTSCLKIITKIGFKFRRKPVKLSTL